MNEEEKKTQENEQEIDYAAEYARLKAENGKLREANARASTEAANYKRQYRATLDEKEQAAAEKADVIEALKAENETFRTEKRVSGYKARLLENGYDASTADTMAKALPDGIPEEFFSEQKKYIEKLKADAMAAALNRQPDITAGKPAKINVQDKLLEDFRKAAGLK